MPAPRQKAMVPATPQLDNRARSKSSGEAQVACQVRKVSETQQYSSAVPLALIAAVMSRPSAGPVFVARVAAELARGAAGDHLRGDVAPV
jgi:hypothetical protein